ncbi:MAG: GDP-mannose 4,6-dehydratase [Candidatus Aminicenantes bacterium]|nr:GDP-mannose 4,6-dehydratase [Candidatus Aminicenantes bacterium]
MEKVLITGAGGFIGSHLAELCCRKGRRVKAFVHYNSRNDWGWLETSEAKNDMEIVAGDIRDFDSVLAAVKGVDVVFHLAALIGIPYSYVSPLAYIQTNVTGTYNILQSGRMLGTKKILITSTSETYGTAQYVPIDENHPLVGQSPYSASKISADQLSLSFYRSFSLPVKIVRPFNVYGPRQSARAVIPTIISQIQSGRRKIKIGNLEPTRDLTFVEDTVRAFLKIEEAEGLFGEVTNIGMNEEISVGDLGRLIADMLGEKVEFVPEKKRVRPDPSEVKRLVCDHSKLIKKTGWKPVYDLKKGLTETIAWIEKKPELYKPEIYYI